MSLSLPLELLDATVDCLSDDSWTLESCALVARAWTGPSQRALFHHIDLTHAFMIECLTVHLAHHPHLQTLVRIVSFSEFPVGSDKIDPTQYAKDIAALLRRLPHLTSITVSYSPVWKESYLWRSFPQVLADFIRQSSLTAMTIQGLKTQYNFQQALSSLEGSPVKRVWFVSLGVQRSTLGFTPNVVRLPCVEFFSLDLGAGGIYDTFQFWFSKPQTTFPCLKRCEYIAHTLAELTVWLTWFRESTLRLDSLSVELKITGYVQEPPTNALSVLDGLHCMHLQLCLAAHNAFVIEWWTAAFQSLADSGATIHFTELTLTFTPHHHSPKLCDALFGVLSHDVFRGVQKIHF